MLVGVDPWSRVDVRDGPSGRTAHIVVDDWSSVFDLSTPEHRLGFNTALLGASAQVMPRLSRLPLRPDLASATGWLPEEINVGFTAPAVLVRIEDDAGVATFTAESRHADGRVTLTHSSGFTLAISDRQRRKGQPGHFMRVHVDEEAGIHLENHPDLWTFLEHCTPKSKLCVDHVGLDAMHFRGLGEAAFFARCLRQLTKLFDWPAETFNLHDATSAEVLNTMHWLCIAGESDIDYALAVTVGNLEPKELDAEPAWFWVPFCVNLARSAVITWVGARGEIYLLDGMAAGLHIESIEEIALELRAERWAKGPHPELVVDPMWPVVEFGNEVRKSSTNAKAWDCRTLALSDRRDAFEALLRSRPQAIHWRTVR